MALGTHFLRDWGLCNNVGQAAVAFYHWYPTRWSSAYTRQHAVTVQKAIAPFVSAAMSLRFHLLWLASS